jgi:hypothetical protein
MLSVRSFAIFPLATLSIASAALAATPATPTFSVPGGTYSAYKTVTLSDATPGASIYYTVTGVTPTIYSTQYTGPIPVNRNMTLKAIAAVPGGPVSVVATASYTFVAAVAPTFSTPGGTYQAYKSITITDATPGASIYYTVTGVTPTIYSTQYTGPISVNRNMTLEAVAAVPGGPAGSVATASYTFVPAVAPAFSKAAGVYQGTQSIAISDATTAASIYYTVTGVTPTTSSTRYTGPVTVSSNMTLKAVAAVPGGPAGPVSTVSYTIVPQSTPVRTPNTSATFFGMNVDYLTAGTPWPVLPIRTIRLWDTGTKWGNLNPTPTTYTWKNLDAQVSMAHANGSQLLYTFGGVPPWALPTNVPIQSITRSGGVVTVTTSSAHGMYYDPTQPASRQAQVTVAGVSNASFDGTFYLTGTPNNNTFTYAQSAANSSASAGTVSAVCGGEYAPSMCAEAPASLSQWDEYVTQLISHLRAGAIQYWEIWNEANDPIYWQGDPRTLVAMASDAKSIIRAVDPAAVFLSPSITGNYETQAECAGSVEYCGTTWIDNWLALGGNSTIDIVSVHAYPNIGMAPEQIQGSIYQLQTVMAKHGNGSLPIWDTESSWRNNTNIPSASDQAGWLARHLLLEQSIGVQRTFWYAYDQPAWGTLWTSTGGLNTAGEAYQQVTQWITGVTVTQPCAEIPASPTTFVCSFTRADGYVAQAVWNTAGLATTYTVPSQYVQYRDLTGALHGVVGGSVEISTSPFLFENESVF